MDQTELIHNTDWDTLIILDACRFDMFKEVYKQYVYGDLQMVESPAGATHEWLKKTFNEFHDCTVYSAHPGINSKDFEVFGYQPNLHFLEIKDLWEEGWDNIIGGSDAGSINKRVMNDIQNKEWHGRNILWYMQPHFPWLGETRIPTKEFEERGVREWDREAYMDLRNGKFDREFVRKAYEDNIRYVMKYVNQISHRIRGKIIVTSDHGELLMDDGLPEDKQFGHFDDLHSIRPELREVPWLELQLSRRKPYTRQVGMR